jgi:hypothetical protein
MAKKAKKVAEPKDRRKAALSAWEVRRAKYGANGISPEVMAERAKAKKAKAKQRPAAKKAKR